MYESEALEKIRKVKAKNKNLDDKEMAFKLLDLLSDENDSKKKRLNSSDYIAWQNVAFNLFLSEIHSLIPPNSDGYNELYLYDALTYNMLIDYFNTPRFD